MKTKMILVDGKMRPCCYSQESPVEPFKFERIIDDYYAYIVDANGKIWNKCICIPENNQPYFHEDCLMLSLHYILYYDPVFAGAKPSDVMKALNVNDPRGKIYDSEWEEFQECKNK